MLQRRRRKDEDEAAVLQKQGLHGLSGDDRVRGDGGCDREIRAASCMDILRDILCIITGIHRQDSTMQAGRG